MHDDRRQTGAGAHTTPSLPGALARLQAVLYLITGLWPVVHMPSFELITGRKRDDWLVKTVGALLAVIGFGLWRGRQRVIEEPDMPLVALGTAATLAIVDVVYYRRGILRWVYLVDAVVEMGLVVGWLGTFWQRRHPQG